MYYFDDQKMINKFNYEPRKVSTLDHPGHVNNKKYQLTESSTLTLNSKMKNLDNLIDSKNSLNQLNDSYSLAINHGTTDFSIHQSISSSSSQTSFNDEQKKKSNLLHKQSELNSSNLLINSHELNNISLSENANNSHLNSMNYLNSLNQNDDKNDSFKSKLFLFSKFYIIKF